MKMKMKIMFIAITILTCNFINAQQYADPVFLLKKQKKTKLIAVTNIAGDKKKDIIGRIDKGGEIDYYYGNTIKIKGGSKISDIVYFIHTDTGYSEKKIIASDVNNITSADVIDYDRDGDKDIIISKYKTSNSIGWFENTSQGFNSFQVLISDVDSPVELITTDFNQDGNTDIITSTYNSDNFLNPAFLYLFKGRENQQGFKDGIIIHKKNTSITYINIKIGKVNDDNKNDIIYKNMNQKIMKVVNQGNDNFSEPQEIYQKSFTDTINSFDVGDLNGDGYDDVVFCHADLDTVKMVWNDGTGNYDNIQIIADNSDGNEDMPIFTRIDDLNNDDANDIVVSFSFSNNFDLYQGNNTKQFSHIEEIIHIASYDFIIDDVDSDGDKDIIFTAGNFAYSENKMCNNDEDVKLTVSDSSISCKNTPVTITAPDTTNYMWFKNNDSLNQNTQSIDVTEPGDYKVVIEGQDGCKTSGQIKIDQKAHYTRIKDTIHYCTTKPGDKDTIEYDTIKVDNNCDTIIKTHKHYHSSPEVSFEKNEYMFCDNNNINLNDYIEQKEDTLTYTFFSDSTLNDTVNAVVDSSGKYYVKATNKYGCFDSDSVKITISTCTSVKEKSKTIQENINIFPNPANRVMNINIGNYDFTSDYTFHLYTTTGKNVFSKEISGSEKRMNISNLSSGYYIGITKKDGDVLYKNKIIIK